MNDTSNEFNGTPEEEAQLTAFVLGELSEMDAAAMARQVAGDPALQREVEAIRATADGMARALATETAPGLTDAQRAAITGGTTMPGSGKGSAGRSAGNNVLFSFLSLRTVWAGAGLAAAACLAIAFLWPAIIGKSRSQGPVAFEEAPEVMAASDAVGLREPGAEREGSFANDEDHDDRALRRLRAPRAAPALESDTINLPSESVLTGADPATFADTATLDVSAARVEMPASPPTRDGGAADATNTGARVAKSMKAADLAMDASHRPEHERAGALLERRADAASPPEASVPGGLGGGSAASRTAAVGGSAYVGGEGSARRGPAKKRAAPAARRSGGAADRLEQQEAGDDVATSGALARANRTTGFERDRAAGDESRELNREAYGRLVDNSFRRPTEAPQSTFSIDVDTASYSNVRRHIAAGTLPPKDAVRIEELINYFDYDYEPATGEHPFSVTTDIRACPWNEGHRLVRIGLRGRDVERDMRPATNLVFLLDVSGSMNQPNKLPLVKGSLRLLVNHLTNDDRVAITVYAGAAGVVLPSTFCDDRESILAAIDNLHAGGPTAGGAGIELAYGIAQANFIEGGVNRVILCTDGDFNVGVASEGALTRLIEEKRESGVFLSVLGFGTGNLQDDRMEKLSGAGNGHFAYIDGMEEARKVLVEEMAGTLVTIAKDVKIQVEFNPTRVGAYRLIGYANRILDAQDFTDDAKDAGEIGAGHTMTALYEITPPGEAPTGTGGEDLRFLEPAPLADAAQTDELVAVKLRYKLPDQDESLEIRKFVRDTTVARPRAVEDFDFAAAVAGFGMMLRESEDKGSVDYDMVLRLAGSEGRADANEREVAGDLVDRFVDQVRRDRLDLAAVFAQSLTSVDLTDAELAAVVDVDGAVRERLDAALAACPPGRDANPAIDRLRVRLAQGRMALGGARASTSLRQRAEFVDLVRQAREISER